MWQTFYYNFKDLQVTVVPGGGAQIDTNAASARNYGLDGDLDFAATDHLTFTASASYLKAYYVSYPDAEGFTALGKAILLANAAGKELPYSPRFSGSLGGNYDVPTPVGEFKSSVSVSYQDAYVVSPTEQPVAPEYFLLNALGGMVVEFRRAVRRAALGQEPHEFLLHRQPGLELQWLVRHLLRAADFRCHAHEELLIAPCHGIARPRKRCQATHRSPAWRRCSCTEDGQAAPRRTL